MFWSDHIKYDIIRSEQSDDITFYLIWSDLNISHPPGFICKFINTDIYLYL